MYTAAPTSASQNVPTSEARIGMNKLWDSLLQKYPSKAVQYAGLSANAKK